MTHTPSSTDTLQGQPEREYRITETGMNLAIAFLKNRRLYDEAEMVLKEIHPIDSAKDCLCGQCQIAKLSSDGEHCEEIAALIQRTREEVLAHLIAKLSEAKSHIESSAMGGSITERNRGRILGILDALIVIGSLRSQPPTTGSTTIPAKGKEV